MTEIVRKTDRFDKIRIHKKCLIKEPTFSLQIRTDRPSDLCNFQRMRQPRTVEIIFTGKKDLRLCLQSAERSGVNDAVAVLLERCAVIMFPFFFAALRIECIVKCVGHMV